MRATVMGAAGLLVALVFMVAPGCAGEDTEKPAPPAVESAKDAAGGQPAPLQASQDTPAPASAEEVAEMLGPSPWHDTVHYLGIAGGALSFPALLAGAVIYFGFTRRKAAFDHRPRRAWRTAHMALGAVAVALSLVHYFGRWVQEGGPNFGLEPPHLSGLFYVLLGVSGVLRFAPPKAWRKRYLAFAQLHRVAFVVAVLTMVMHALYEVARFNGQ